MTTRPIVKPPSHLCAYHRGFWAVLCRRGLPRMANVIVTICRASRSARCSWSDESER